ncbi:MAG: glycosyltransferase [Chloroflexi bacterium]|nr:glycosyltransferase [Chloroflexota bacterium]
MARTGIAVVIPVFDDWECAREVVQQIRALVPSAAIPLTIFLVDDGSATPAPADLVGGRRMQTCQVHVIELFTNVGHQRAIAIGLATVDRLGRFEAVVVMDGDGEDRVSEVDQLLKAHGAQPEAVIVAKRGKRREPFPFKPFYGLYQGLFRMFTGRRLDFGNFTLLPASALTRVVHSPDLWNHYPATIMKSRVPIHRVRVDRGTRYFGKSRMNFVSLVNHGLSAIAVFVDVVFVRLLVVALASLGVAVAAGLVVVLTRMITGVNIPTWATIALGLTALAVVQVLALLVITSFQQLATRSRVADPPAVRSESFVKQVRRLA